MNVSLADVLSGAAAHAVPLTAECAGYLVLAAADQAVLAPRHMLAADLELCLDGSVRVARARACEECDAERDLRALLDELLLAASSVTPALLRATRRASSGSIATLLREIETALIPVNRAAARRALARLQRETARALEGGKISREPQAEIPRTKASRASSPLPPSVELALAAIPMPAPAPPLAQTNEPRSEPVSARPLPSVLLVPSDPVPPPTPRPTAKLVPGPVAVLPSLSPPAVGAVEVETRPEPVVLRASARPPAPPPSGPPTSRPLTRPPAPALSRPPAPILPRPPARRAESKPITPVLGTVVAPRTVAPPAVEHRDTIPATPLHEEEPEVVFDAEGRTVMPDDIELIYLDAGPDDLDTTPDDFGPVVNLTEECPPVSEDEELVPIRDEDPIPTPLVHTQRLVRPIVPTVMKTLLPPPAEPEPPTITEPEPSPIAELARLALADAEPEQEAPAPALPELISEVDFAVLVDESELPAWATDSAETALVTPPPRHALPKARPSDVEELLGRLAEAPLSVDELRTGLQQLAGLELTPSPAGIRPLD